MLEVVMEKQNKHPLLKVESPQQIGEKSTIDLPNLISDQEQ